MSRQGGTPFGYAILGAGVGMLAVSCWIGGAIGWEQRNLWPAWLSVPLGAGMGPMYLLVDLESLVNGKFNDLIALPQALLGGAVCAALGWLIGRTRLATK